jgi:hypothetical protein
MTAGLATSIAGFSSEVRASNATRNVITLLVLHCYTIVGGSYALQISLRNPSPLRRHQRFETLRNNLFFRRLVIFSQVGVQQF